MPSTITVPQQTEALLPPAGATAARRRARPRTVATPLPTIIHVAAECWPYAWSGGLGHAVADLAMQQVRNGRSAIVVVPLYRAAREKLGTLRDACTPFVVHQAGADEPIRCLEMQPRTGEPRVVFVEHDPSFDREGLYGPPTGDFADNDRRFALFARAALAFVRRIAESESAILHVHDWHTALAPVYQRTILRDDPVLRRVPAVLSVHNAGYQGLFSRETLGTVGLPESLWHFNDMEWYGQLSYLKGGLRYADVVTTVSATHATEICSEMGGFGLQEVFRSLGDRFVGIRNGIDHAHWNPERDPEIPASFSPSRPNGKERCKAELQLGNRLPRTDVPLFAMSARMVHQKGLDLVLGSRVVRESDAQFVFLGQGEPRYEEGLASLAAAQPNRIAVRSQFTDRVEHRLLAGADFLLMPSLYEPCGLTQMRAQRYGTLPVARRVGGLAETIVDGETGFLFDGYSTDELDRALERAMALHANPAALKRRAVDAMCRDFSWSEPLAAYDRVYERALASRA